MTAAIVQFSTPFGTGGSNATYPLVFGSNITAGNAVVVFSLMSGGSRATRGSVADTASGVWAGVGTAPVDDSTNAFAIDRFLSLNHPGGVNTVTFTPNGGSAGGGCVAVEISGLKTSSALDGTGNAVQLQVTPGTATDGVTSGSDTNASQPAIILGFSAHTGGSQTPSVGTGFTNVGTWAGLFGDTLGRVEYKRITATGSQSATFTTTGNTAHLTGMMLLLEAVASSSAGRNRTLMGFG